MLVLMVLISVKEPPRDCWAIIEMVPSHIVERNLCSHFSVRGPKELGRVSDGNG